MGEIGGKTITLLVSFPVGPLNGNQLLVHSPHLLEVAPFLVRHAAALRRWLKKHMRLFSSFIEGCYDIVKQYNFPCIAQITIIMIHDLNNFAQLFVPLKLLAFKVQIETQFAQAYGAKSKRLLISFVKLWWSVHKALVGLAVPHGEYMAQFVAGGLYSPVLYELCYLWIEHSSRLGSVCSEVWMVTGIALNTNTPALFSHTENKSPAIFGVQVCICKYKQTLIWPQVHVILKIFEYLTSMELFHSCIMSYSRLDNSLPLKFRQILFNMVILDFICLLLGILACSLFSLNSQDWHTWEKQFEDGVHVIEQHLLKLVFFFSSQFNLISHCFRCLILIRKPRYLTIVIPHFQNDNLVNIPIFLMFFETLYVHKN